MNYSRHVSIFITQLMKNDDVLKDEKQSVVGMARMAVTVCNSWNDVQTRTRGGHRLHTEYPPRGMESDRGAGEYKSLTGS